MLIGCHTFIPKDSTKISSTWVSQDYQRQDQVEILWKQQQFSFLLYQKQHGKDLSLIALTLMGQPLFELNFNGEKVVLIQCVDQLKYLPFNYFIRDILVATYPNFTHLAQKEIIVEYDSNKENVFFNQKLTLSLTHEPNRLALMNLHVPYKLFFYTMSQGLE